MPTRSFTENSIPSTGYVGGSITMSYEIKHVIEAGNVFPSDTDLLFRLTQSGSTTLSTTRESDAGGGNLFKSVTNYDDGSVTFSLDNFSDGSATFQSGFLANGTSGLGNRTFTIYDSVDFTVGAKSFYQQPYEGVFWSSEQEYRTNFTTTNKYWANAQNINGYKMRLVLSENDVFSSGDVTLKTIDISELTNQGSGVYRFDDIGFLPEGLEKGEYKIGLIHDYNFQFREDNEGNNTTLIGTIVVGNPTTGDSDFDQDGFDDILFFNAAQNKVGQIEMAGETWSSLGKAGNGWEAITTGVFDGDDTSADVLWFNASTGWTGRFDMDGGDQRWSQIGRATSGWEAIDAGDFNGDGVDDILWYNAAKNKIGQYVMNSDGVPTWDSLGTLGSGWFVAGTGDFNEDGTDDILFQSNTGAMGQFRMSSDGSFQWISLGKLGANWDIAGTGDLSGDGDDDILVFNEAGGRVGYFEMYSSGKSWVSLGDTGDDWDVAGLGDYNNDSRADVLWRHDDGRMGVYEMTGWDEYEWNAIGRAGADWEAIM